MEKSNYSLRLVNFLKMNVKLGRKNNDQLSGNLYSGIAFLFLLSHATSKKSDTPGDLAEPIINFMLGAHTQK